MGEIAKPKPDADFLCFCIFRLRRLYARFRPQIPSPLDVLCQVVHFTTQAGSHLSKHVGGTHSVWDTLGHTHCVGLGTLGISTPLLSPLVTTYNRSLLLMEVVDQC